MLYDAALGLYLTKTRAYNPKTGRFLQRDILDERGRDGIYKGFPFGKDAVGTNLYAWAGNNPINRIDPSGQSAFSDSLRSFARALIYAIVYVVKMVMWNNTVREANQRAQAIKQPPLPVARPRSYAEYVFGPSQRGFGGIPTAMTNNYYTARKKYVPDYKVRQKAAGELGLDAMGPYSSLISQSLALNDLRRNGNTVSSWTNYGFNSTLNILGSVNNKYISGGIMLYHGAKYIDTITDNPNNWTCMNCHQYTRAELQGLDDCMACFDHSRYQYP